MKKLILIIAVIAITTSSLAQTKYGLKLGVNLANGSGEGFKDTDNRIAPAFGGFVRVPMAERLVFQPEVIYSPQGSKETAVEEGINIDVTTTFDYLNFPLMLKYYLDKGLNFQFGPQVGYLISSKVKMEFLGRKVDVDVKDQFKNLDFGINFGVGYDLDMGLGFDLRYNLGLTDIVDSNEIDTDGKHGVVQFTAGYAF
ncbi:porin family protein [Carboxylicivirga sp. N1Y90]|uniref:porin family protein n=1 Tax=Carboxylicivirga fragile TaxID=3417571 RepID=UPI003D328F3F|nr:PorT family protein [Marinilabiliaceae bacterium N1Y90]